MLEPPSNHFIGMENVGPQQAMYSINGVPAHGFVVDPGASAPLIGTETFRRHVVANLRPRGIGYKISKTNNRYTGISGCADTASGRVDMPIGLEGVGLAFWKTDLLGGTGSLCPALLANSSLLALKAASVTDVSPKHGGIISLDLQPGRTCFFQNLAY